VAPAFTYPDRPDAWVPIVPAVERFPIPGEPNFVDNRDVSVLLAIVPSDLPRVEQAAIPARRAARIDPIVSLRAE